MKCRHLLPAVYDVAGTPKPAPSVGELVNIVCGDQRTPVAATIYEVLPDGSVGVVHEEIPA